MPAVFLHGVPETSDVWAPLVSELGVDDAIALRLPGFGDERPDGFDPTMYGYAEWLAGEVSSLDGPLDIVAHDWGTFLSARVLSDRPSNVRSWVTDGSDITGDFRWHDMARLWQTPGEGEAFMETMLGSSDEERASLLVGVGVPEAAASAMAARIDRTMAECILVLYRSATQVGPEWGPGLDRIDIPTMVLEADADPYRGPGKAAQLATRLGATLTTLPERGHWWMLEDPAVAADVLQTFWRGLP